MSRNGKIPVIIPEKVKAEVKDNFVCVEGPKGKLEKAFDQSVTIVLEEGQISVRPVSANKHSRSMFGTARSIIKNMVNGVVSGYKKELEISGVGFRASLNGNLLQMSLGLSHEIKYTVPDGVKVTVGDSPKGHVNHVLAVEGADKHMVGQVAADIKSYAPMEPYKGKGVAIVGEFVRRKEGKKSK